jgi:RNA polymerase sigma factor (TIGR02999 family)
MEGSRLETTALLDRVRQGSNEARNELVPRVYQELHRIAKRQMRREAQGHTLQPTALVNEAYLKLIDQSTGWQNRTHFFAVAAQVMRRLLVDHARSRRAEKRGGGMVHVDVDHHAIGVDAEMDRVLTIDEALTRLATFDSRQSRIVELRFFGGLKDEEIAEVLGISLRTVRRDWQMAKAWLYGELGGSSTVDTP